MEQFGEDLEVERGPRPGFLTFLCILTFVYTGFSAISNLFSLVSGPLNEEKLSDVKVLMMDLADQMKDAGMTGLAEVYEKLYRITEATNANHYVFTLTGLVILAIGIFAAIKMLKGVKLGFHLYIIYSLLSVTQLYLFVSASTIPTFMLGVNLFISALFIVLYGLNVKWMR